MIPEFKIAGMIIASENAGRSAGRLASIFGFESVSDEHFISVGSMRFAKTKQYGKSGSFIVETDNIERAVDYLKGRGVEFIDESARYNINGELSLIYLDCLVSGFAVRLEQEK